MAYDIHKTPQDDYLFQKIFASKGNEDMLAEMLEEILEIKIKEIEITNEYTLNKVYKDTKEGRIDLKAVVDNNKVIDIEMQIENKNDMKDRPVSYAAALYHETIEEGEKYNDSKEVIIISILSFNLFEDDKYMVSGRFRRDDTYEEISDKIRLYYIQLPKFLKQNDKKKKKLAQWLYFISQKNREELKMAIEENDKVARAERLLEEALADPETREILRIKRRIRYDKMMDERLAEKRKKEYEEAVKKKVEAAKKKVEAAKKKVEAAKKEAEAAKEKSRKEGRKEGKKEGRKEGITQIAKKMKEKGMSIEEIIQITELEKEEIEKL